MTLASKYNEFYEKGAKDRSPLPQFEVRGWPKNRIEAIMFESLRGGNVLDIGCGDGTLLYQLRDHFDELIGLEYSPHRLESARRNLSGLAFRGLTGSAEDMKDVPSASIDVIVSADTIEHIPDVYAAVGEMHRVLKPGGSLVINTPNIAFLKKRLVLLAGRFPSTSQPNEGLGSDILFDGGHLHYFTFRSLGLVLNRAGFRQVRQRGFGPLGRVHDMCRNLTSVGVQLVAERG
jgi:SAM-dependent methyltransferase